MRSTWIRLTKQSQESKDLISRITFTMMKNFDLIPGVRKLIEHYHENGIKLILASSATMVPINMVFENSDWSPISVERSSGADLKESKPHPEVFFWQLKWLENLFENCMVIEDSTNGILAATPALKFSVRHTEARIQRTRITHWQTR